LQLSKSNGSEINKYKSFVQPFFLESSAFRHEATDCIAVAKIMK